MSTDGIKTISTRRERKASKSRNDLDQIPVALPVLGETQAQISNIKNVHTYDLYYCSITWRLIIIFKRIIPLGLYGRT